MEHVQAGLQLRIFRLPACVDAEALWVVRAEMSHGRPDDACVLDFSRTRHIRFQDLRDFARSARRWLDAARPDMAWIGRPLRFNAASPRRK